MRILLFGAPGLAGRETSRLALGRGDVDGVAAPKAKSRPFRPKSTNCGPSAKDKCVAKQEHSRSSGKCSVMVRRVERSPPESIAAGRRHTSEHDIRGD
jgi:hypothetical protein